MAAIQTSTAPTNDHSAGWARSLLHRAVMPRTPHG
jgi:hypothetical protein